MELRLVMLCFACLILLLLSFAVHTEAFPRFPSSAARLEGRQKRDSADARDSTLPTASAQKGINQGHRKKCTLKETRQAACLGSGTCYALDLAGNGQRSAHCQCGSYETGLRCEQFVFVAGGARDWNIKVTAIVVLCLAGVAVIVLFVWLYFKCKEWIKKENKKGPPK